MSAVQRFRKKPVVIEALRYDGPSRVEVEGPFIPREAAEFANVRLFACSAFTVLHVGSVTHGGPNQYAPAIATLEGTMRIDAGDWVIKGVKGEFYPCKPDIFAATYEAVVE